MKLKQYHVSVLSNFLLAYDKYARTYNKDKISANTYPGVFFLLDKVNLSIGINKASQLLKKLDLSGNKLIVIETVINKSDLQENDFTGTGLGRYVKTSVINVSQVYYLDKSTLVKARVEDVVAESYQVLKPVYPRYSELAPRSVSILPIANGCQAKCAFCFSTASISRDQKQALIDIERVEYVLQQAKNKGATRAVITGGGEPGLLPEKRLENLIKLCKKYFDKVVLITNGYFISNSDEPKQVLTMLVTAGVSILSISRHHYDEYISEQIMTLAVNFENISRAYKSIGAELNGMDIRLICVLQKGGIDSTIEIDRYISWASQQGVKQICFKELYVSSSTESMFYEDRANTWSYEHQVPLSMLVKHATDKNWHQSLTLPWGSPIYEVRKFEHQIQVAAYTEPSISWELDNKLCRSWNLMANGHCYASLESMDSQVLIQN